MLKTLIMKAAFIAFVGSISFAAHAIADTQRFDVPAGDLIAALESFAKQADVDLVYQDEQVKGLRTGGVRGTFSPREAVMKLLEGTPLQLRTDEASGALLITTPLPSGGPAPSTSATDENPPKAAAGADDATVREKRSFWNRFRLAQAETDPSAQDERSESQHSEKDTSSREDEKKVTLEEVLVTGTYIRHADPLSPVLTITNADLVIRGYSTLDQAIQQLPQNFRGGGAAQDTNGITGTGGESPYNQTFSSGVNLHGLGTGATLVLLNGRRLPQTSSGFSTDISQIPVSVIDRVEILTDGASATYGSDAIAGVVNIITRNDFSGFETGIRANSLSDGKQPNYGASLTGGFDWNSGNLVANYDYERENPLFARARSFTSTIPDPVSLFPEHETSSAYLSLRQQLKDRVVLSSDLLASNRKFEAQTNYGGLGANLGLETVSGRAEQVVGAAQLDYAISADWTATFLGQFAREKDVQHYDSPAYAIAQDYVYDTHSIEPRIDGALFGLPGGSVRMAFGGSIRKVRLRTGSEYDFLDGSGISTVSSVSDRDVDSAYGEILVPIVGQKNAVPLIKQLTVDIAARYDKYSDFGSTSNPKFSLQWIVTDQLSLQGSYAESFKAPVLYTLDTGIFYAAYVWDATDPSSPSGSRRTLLLDGNNPELTPETAKSWNVGLTFKPSGVPGLKAGISFFDINFESRIVRLIDFGFFDNVIQDAHLMGSLVNLDPSLAEIDQILTASGRTIYTYVGPYTPDSIEAIANIGWVNAASSRVRGLDGTLRYERGTSAGNFSVEASGSYLEGYDNRVTATSPEFSIVNTLRNPNRFRGKLDFGWMRNGWATNARLNYSSSYRNANDPGCQAPGCSVASWTTVDLSVSYTSPANDASTLLDGVRISLDASNVLDRAPPFAYSDLGLNYDPPNANPLMRAIGIGLTKSW